MSRPGDEGWTLTRYETDASGVKCVRSFPTDIRVLLLAEAALAVARCKASDCRELGRHHEAGECYRLEQLEDLASICDDVKVPPVGDLAREAVWAQVHHDPPPRGA